VKANNNRWVTQTLSATTVEQFACLSVGRRRPMVVLNACQVGRLQRRLAGFGGFSKAFLTAGAGVFVSSLWSVGDEPARSFVEAFYGQLNNGKTISEATVQAREAARKAGDLTWLAYVVYANPQATLVK
jgi:CHAT domain-containing protein